MVKKVGKGIDNYSASVDTTDMKNTGRTNRNLISDLMNEYVNWGGPVITRAAAREDCILKGFDAKAIDVLVFSRQSVPAPENAEAMMAFHRQVQVMEGIAA